MGRGKIDIKRIENTSNRQVTYSKRRNGLLKKAKEISVLCDANVSVVIFASNGKMHEYCSPSTTLVDILERYHKQSGKKLWDAKHENLNNEIDRIKKENDRMQIELRHLRGEDITSLHGHKDLMALEDALQTGLASIRAREMEVFREIEKNEKMLEEENERLKYVLHQQRMAMEGGGDMENGYQQQQQQQVREYQPQMPFAFHNLQIQPNLQERF